MAKAAEELVTANTKAGATAETQEINNEMVALQTRLGTLKQSLGDEITAEGGSVSSSCTVRSVTTGTSLPC